MNEDGKAIANFLLNDFKGMLNKRKMRIENCPISPELLGWLVRRFKEGTIDKKTLRTLTEKLLDNGKE